MQFSSPQTLLSIIIPAFEDPQCLKECIISIQQQKHSDTEIIVVNDGGSHELEILIQEMRQSYPKLNLSYFYQENLGPGPARTVAAKMARGEYLLPLDSDDLLVPASIEKLNEDLLKHPETDFLYGDYQCFGDSEDRLTFGPLNLEELYFRNTLPNSSVQRRKLYLEVGGQKHFKYYGYEEWDYYLRLMKIQPVVRKASFSWIKYRIQNTKGSNSLSERGKTKDAVLRAEIIKRNQNSYTKDYQRLAKKIIAVDPMSQKTFAEHEIIFYLTDTPRMVEKLKKKSVLIWGTGGKGLQDYKLLSRHGVNASGFVDGLEKKSGTIFEGMPVYGKAILKERKNNYFFIISTLFFYEVENILKNSGREKFKDWFTLH